MQWSPLSVYKYVQCTYRYVPVCTKMYLFVPGKDMCKLVCTEYVHVHTWLYLSQPCFTGALCDANTLVPDVHQHPADQDIVLEGD
jgi:hypothetical protein